MANGTRPMSGQSEGGGVPKCDCWCFGAPCQSFSIAGRREGLDGESGLIREVFRILRETREEDRPEWLVYENVKGMLSSSKGFDFFAILAEMDELGYDCEWQLFNSKDWGVPQNRERVYTVGHSRRFGSAKVFPVEGADGENHTSIRQIGRVDGANRHNTNIYRVYASDGIAATLQTMKGGGREPHVAMPVLTPERAEKRQNGRRFKENGDPAFTLTSQDRHGVAVSVETGRPDSFFIDYNEGGG